MPNSAYLYSSDEPDDWDPRLDEDYCESRWLIPLAWLSFFRPEDLRLVTISAGASSWQEVKLCADKKSAFELFARRKRLLLALAEGRISRKRISEFTRGVGERSGRYLLLNPSEVVADDLPAAERYAEALTVLGTGMAPVNQVRAAIRAASHVKVEGFSPQVWLLEGQILGYGA